ncbi:hypothetical protein GCM10020216_073240 [Nonomuraea helvata]
MLTRSPNASPVQTYRSNLCRLMGLSVRRAQGADTLSRAVARLHVVPDCDGQGPDDGEDVAAPGAMGTLEGYGRPHEILKIALTDDRHAAIQFSPEVGVKLSGGSGQVRGVGPIG